MHLWNSCPQGLFVTSLIRQHSILSIPIVRCIVCVHFPQSNKHLTLKTFIHTKHSPFNSTDSFLTGRNKNQPSKPDSFHLTLTKHIILLQMCLHSNFDIIYISHINNCFKKFQLHRLQGRLLCHSKRCLCKWVLILVFLLGKPFNYKAFYCDFLRKERLS